MSLSNTGQLVPVIFFPRFTSLVGTLRFEGFAVDVQQFVGAHISVWRGPLLGSASPTVKFYFEESTDRDTWSACSGTSSGVDPGEDTEEEKDISFAKRWFRMAVDLTGTAPSVTVWAQGFCIKREK